MSDSTRILLVQGKAAAKAGDVDEAKMYLEWVLRSMPANDQKIEAWYWLAEIESNVKQKRDYLEDILAQQPTHIMARKALAVVDGRLKVEDMVGCKQIVRKHIPC
jgi:tetratricopeptide (TPR) repeat protein